MTDQQTAPYADADNLLATWAQRLADQARDYNAGILRGGTHAPAAADLLRLARKVHATAKAADRAAEQREHGGQSRTARTLQLGWHVRTGGGWGEIDMLSTYGGVVRITTTDGRRFEYEPAEMVLCRTEREARAAARS